MARSSLSGVDRRLPTPSGHDTASLGPSDSSDSGSDLAGIEHLDDGDPAAPIDVTTADDREHPSVSSEGFGPGAATDAAGTGERRSGVGDAGALDAPDIAPDRIVSVSEISAAYDDTEAASQADEQAPDPRFADIAGAVQIEAPEADEASDEEGEAESPARAAPVGGRPGGKRARRSRAKSAAPKAR